MESVAITVKMNVPDAPDAGVPDSTPPEDKVMPAGSAPVRVNVTVPTPPVWVNVIGT